MIAVILLILVGVVFLVLPKFRKEAAPEKPETIKVEAAEKSYAAGSRLSEKNFRVYGISGKKKQLLDAVMKVLGIKSAEKIQMMWRLSCIPTGI